MGGWKKKGRGLNNTGGKDAYMELLASVVEHQERWEWRRERWEIRRCCTSAGQNLVVSWRGDRWGPQPYGIGEEEGKNERKEFWLWAVNWKLLMRSYYPSYEMWDTLETFCIKCCITGPPRFNIFAIPPVTRSTYTKTSIMKKASQTSAYILY